MAESLIPILGAAVAAFLLAAALTPVVRRFGLRWAIGAEAGDGPSADPPTPALGGVPIVVAGGLAATGGLLLLGGPQLAFTDLVPHGPRWGAPLAIVTAAAIVFTSGIIGSFTALGAAGKLLPRFVAAVVLVASGVLIAPTGLHPLDVALSFLWFVGIASALVLLDQVEGLAGGVAALAAGVLGTVCLLEGRPAPALVAFALAGSVGGFLLHNIPPATIRMGNSGALTLGIVLSALALVPDRGGSLGVLIVVGLPVLLVLVPLLDTGLASATRVMEGRSPMRGGTGSALRRLAVSGRTGRGTVVLLWGLAAAGAVVALALRAVEGGLALALGGALPLGIVLSGAYLLQVQLPSHLTGTVDAEAQFQRTILWNRARPALLICLDVLVIVVAYAVMYHTLGGASGPPAAAAYLQLSLPLIVGAKLVGFAFAGLYDRTGELDDPLRLVRASTVGSFVAVTVLVLLIGFELSRGALLLDFLLCTVLLGMVRLIPGMRAEES